MSRSVPVRWRVLAASLVAAALWSCAKTADAPTAPASAGDLHFRVSAPNGPFRVGSNALHIELEDSKGKPVDDAQVSVRWSMPAMGAMPPMQGRAPARRAGAGRYEADVELQMNGTWRLEIEARRPAGEVATLDGTLATGRAVIGLGGDAPVTQPDARAGDVRIDAQRRQEIGIRTGVVERGRLVVSVRAVGRVTVDERRLEDVSLKVRGWITKLHASALGDPVRAGEPLFELYSPELLAAQQEYLHARQSLGEASGREGGERMEQLVRAARARLRLWDLSASDLDALDRRGEPSEAVTIRAPVSGFVIEKNIVEGGAVEPGARLLRIAPLDQVWVEAEVYENQLQLIRPGQPVTISLPSMAERRIEGRISYVYPTLEGATRTARVRVELPNPDLAIRPDMYANVEFQADLGERTLVPATAVLYAGPRRIVFVDLGDGRLRPREVQIGVGNGDVYEVLGGLEPGEAIVLSGNYLVASESRLESALGQW